ncbi:MAG: GGDEF domain-containing protein, partial [Gammaproteobacteria bacterium]
LGLFSTELSRYVPHQFFRYINPDLDIEQEFGHKARYSCTYNLHLSDEKLGKISLRRSTKFEENEIKTIESLICYLLYPLRNALLYQDAVQMAQKDPLTGIQNRAAYNEAIYREISHAKRHDASCSLIIIDIDLFKKVNDRYGHLVGDCALKSVSHTAASCIRDGDALFRYGGEEFVVVMRESGLSGARRLAERIRHNIESNPCHCAGSEINLTVSVGVSTYEPGDTSNSLFARADKALYYAKKSGRNRVSILTSGDD